VDDMTAPSRLLSRFLLAAFVLAGLLVASAPFALACSCVRFASAEAHLAQTDVVFVGRVVESRAAGEHRMITTFEVLETLKGTPPRTVRIAHSADVCCICGMTFRAGEQTLVFAHARGDGTLSTSSCSAPRFPIEQYRQALRAD
jgi:hypothetical protein